MTAYILRVAGAVILSAVLSLIVPEGKMGAFLRGICKLFLVAVLISPVLGFFSEGKFSFTSGSSTPSDEAYLLHCAEILSREDEKVIQKMVKEEFGLEAEVQVERGADYSYKKIFVHLPEDGITVGDEHIHIASEIKSRLVGYGCETEVVW